MVFSTISQKLNSLYDILRNTFFYLSHAFVVPLRYKVNVKGARFLDHVKVNKNTGILFLANHSSHLDATIITIELLKLRIPLSIWALDLTFKLPYLRWAARHSRTVKVVKVPNINERRSRKYTSKLHKLISRTGDGLRQKKNFLIFPSGRCKLTPIEKIDGKSAVPQIIRQCPDVNIVLVRITGMWGSRFSYATKRESRWSTETIRWYDLLWQSVKMIFFNAIFFIPKRQVTVEFLPVGDDFPRFGSRLEIARYLERYYNEAWGPEGEPLLRVPDYFWKGQYTAHEYVTKHYQFDISLVPKPLRNSVVKLIADKADLDCREVDFDMYLGRDLGFDSLDVVEILTELERDYGIRKFVPENVTTVGHLIAIAAGVPVVCEVKKGEFHRVDQHVPLLQRLKSVF
jgi:long-chain-fatty-acid--[acyl-carrier-protein] ligase